MSVSPDGFTRRVAVKMRSADLSRMWHDSSVANVFPYWTNPVSNYSVIDSLKATGQQNRFTEEGSRSSLDHAGGVGPRWLHPWTLGRCLNFSTEEFHAIIFTRVQVQHASSHSQWWLFPVKFSEKNCLKIVLAQVQTLKIRLFATFMHLIWFQPPSLIYAVFLLSINDTCLKSTMPWNWNNPTDQLWGSYSKNVSEKATFKIILILI